MPGTLNVGGHDIITHSGTAGAGTINLVDQAGNTILTDSGSGMSISSNVAFPAGHVIKTSEYNIARGTYNSSPIWPLDDTRPQLNEGVTVFSQSYTPTDAASKLLIQVFNLFLYETSNVADAAVAGLFISGNNDCLIVFPSIMGYGDQGGKHSACINGSYLMDSYSGAKTFYIQKGTAHQSVGKWYTNGWQDVADRFDGYNNPFGRVLITEIS